MASVIGLDIGGTNLRIGLVRDGVLERGETYSSHDILSEGDEIELLGALIDKFRGGEKSCPVSIGFPAPIGSDGKTVLNLPNIIKKDGSHAFSGKNVADPLEKILNVKVHVNKDANHLLRYDAFTAGVDGVLVGCYIGTGFGSAVMIDGKFVKGKHGSAMETAHIPFYKSEIPCNCGKTGCAECHASGRAATYMLRDHYPGMDFPEVYRNHAHEAPVRDLIEGIGVTVAILATLFDPHALFIGGGVISKDFPKDILIESILRNSLAPYPRNDLSIIFSEHDAFAGVIGAALSADNPL